jgi:hypothetical protein
MKLKKILAGHLLMLALVFPHVVVAEDFTFNVGVNFLKIHPDVTTLIIRCGVLNENNDDAIGQGSKDVKVPANGEINNTVQIKFNADSGKNPANATAFICSINVSKPNASGGISSVSPSPGTDIYCKDANYDWRCSKNGTRLVKVLTGNISGGSTGNTSGKVGSKSGGNSSGKVGIKTKRGIIMDFRDE